MLSNIFWTFLPPRRPAAHPNAGSTKRKLVRSTQQFNVSLYQILYNYKAKVPPIVVTCFKYLDDDDDKDDAKLRTEKLFRKSAPYERIRELREKANGGEEVVLETPHEAATLLKHFFRELDEPILGYDSYEAIVGFGNSGGKVDKFALAKDILNANKIPKDNILTFKVFMHLLNKVASKSDQNQMTAESLGQCTGPSLTWPKNRSMYIEELTPIAKFVAFAIGSAPSLLGRLPKDFDEPATPKIESDMPIITSQKVVPTTSAEA